jgi:hypothetical protein
MSSILRAPLFLDEKIKWRPKLPRSGSVAKGNGQLAGIRLAEAGFQFERLDTGYIRGPKPMTFMYEGSAHPR